MTTAIAIYLLLIGLICGSFFNVVGLRVPKKQSLLYPPSTCGSCGTRLRKRDLVPVFSYLFARGRCRHCKKQVSLLYPLGESATGLLFMLMYIRIGLSLELVAALLFVSLCIIVTVSDLVYMLIPNNVLLAFLPLVLIVRLFQHGEPLWHYGLGALLGGGILLLVHIVSRGQMGLGDVKLFALFGLIIGFKSIIVALLLACLAGTLIGGLLMLIRRVRRKQAIPFGPFLALGSLIAYCYGDAIIDWYLNVLT
ncbi:type 4 prepilin peptidase 1 [Paenibacillus taihuensis]|uniref:Type 4 prepilin peptidase 1 n=1 Tax=Paenibacillus taihuensis TaxID=1156355 RepID=A0A3D9R0A8_9BACL|nr:A24 family peptidase [Paenibacillus taihuensis]REE66672.1 type 4 prepilin peptidase 1 [Paenibacillus taihuensis]